MTSYSTTISNGLTVSGNGPTEKWGEFLWGTDEWLGPQSIYIQFIKGIINGVSLSDALEKHLYKGIPNGITLSDIIYKEVVKSLANAVNASDALSKIVTKQIGNDIGLATSISKLIHKLISDTIAIDSNQSATVKKGIWDIVFRGGTTDGTEQSVPAYSEHADPTTTWTSQAASPSIWTEL